MTSRTAQRQAARAHKRIVLELQNRIGMLCVHGGILLMIGMMMILTGAPAPAEDWWGPTARLALGGAAMIGGAVLLVGTALGDDSRRGWSMMVVGSVLAGLWHLGLTFTYAYAAATARMEILSPGEPLSEAVTSRGYIPLVYFGYVLLVLIHSITLVRLGPPPR